MVNKEIKKGDEMKLSYQLNIVTDDPFDEKIILDLDSNYVNEEKVTRVIYNYLQEKGLQFEDLEGAIIYVKETNTGQEFLTYNVTSSVHGLYKISIRKFRISDGLYSGHKNYAFNPKENLRTNWNNNIHKEWLGWV